MEESIIKFLKTNENATINDIIKKFNISEEGKFILLFKFTFLKKY